MYLVVCTFVCASGCMFVSFLVVGWLVGWLVGLFLFGCLFVLRRHGCELHSYQTAQPFSDTYVWKRKHCRVTFVFLFLYLSVYPTEPWM